MTMDNDTPAGARKAVNEIWDGLRPDEARQDRFSQDQGAYDPLGRDQSDQSEMLNAGRSDLSGVTERIGVLGSHQEDEDDDIAGGYGSPEDAGLVSEDSDVADMDGADQRQPVRYDPDDEGAGIEGITDDEDMQARRDDPVTGRPGQGSDR